MVTQPQGPPSTAVTAMNWDDVKRFATDVGDLLAGLQAVAPEMNNQSHFTIMPGSFHDAQLFATSTANLGTSLQTASTWMLRLLTDVQSGLTNAVTSLSGVDTLQKENGQSLLSQLQNINTDLSTGPAAGPTK